MRLIQNQFTNLTVITQGIDGSGRWNLYNSGGGIVWPYQDATPYNLKGNTSGITRFVVRPGANDFLPEPLQTQTVYYMRRFTTPTGGYKAYFTLAQAQSDSNPITFTPFTYPKYFNVDYINKTYGTRTCAEYANPIENEIVCCPPPVPEYRNLYDTVTVNGVLVSPAAHSYITFNNGAVYFPATTSGGSSTDKLFLTSMRGASNVLLFGGQMEATMIIYFAFWHSASITYFRASDGAGLGTAYYYDAAGYNQLNFTLPLQNYFLPGGFNINNFPESVSCSIQTNSKAILPPTCKLVMPDAWMTNTRRPFNVGNQVHTLTLEESSSTYYSDVVVLHGVPGRIHLKARYYPYAGSSIKYYNTNTANGVLINQSPDQYGNIGFTPGGGIDFQDTYLSASGLPFNNYNAIKSMTVFSQPGGGQVHFDSRYDLPPDLSVPENLRSSIKPVFFAVAFSEYGSTRFSASYPLNSIYPTNTTIHSNYFYLYSYHPGCYITTL